MTVMDLGANIGQYTLVAARRVGPQGRVHAFEPTPHLAEHVRRNLELNGLDNSASTPPRSATPLGRWLCMSSRRANRN